MRGLPWQSVFHGAGPLADEIAAAAPANVTLPGWTEPDLLFADDFAYVGTSRRGAFGRSAVEAAMAAIPVLLSDRFGAADMLYPDPDLRRRFVLPLAAVDRWRAALRALYHDEDLRVAVSDSLHVAASALTVDRSLHAVAAVAGQAIGR